MVKYTEINIKLTEQFCLFFCSLGLKKKTKRSISGNSTPLKDTKWANKVQHLREDKKNIAWFPHLHAAIILYPEAIWPMI